MSFGGNIIEEIKNRCNIVDYIGRVIPLKRAGSNYKGVCPFHNEKTPSFVVSESKQIFTCFGCGASGDIIEFAKRYYNLDFGQAVEKIAEEYNIEMKHHSISKEKNDILYEINKEAAIFFYNAISKGENKGYSYMSKRGITPATIARFGIGYADESWDSLYRHLTSKGYDNQILLKLGLISESKGKYYDKFRDRVIFPIINTRGKVIGFGGRTLGDAMPKYLNSPETPIFQKKNNLYALNITRKDVGKEDCAIIVEGYMDVVSLWQAGIRNVSASLGTALTENQIKLLSRYSKNIILSYDSDEAGRNAALRGIDIIYKEGLQGKVLHVTEGKDPDEFVKKKGPEAYKRLIVNAQPYVEYKIDSVKRKINVSNEQGRVKFFKSVVEILKNLTPIEADIYIKKISATMKISEGALRSEVFGERRQIHIKPAEKDNVKAEKKDITMLEKYLLKLLFTETKYYREILPYSHIFTSSAKNIFIAFRDAYKENDSVSKGEVYEFLTNEEKYLLDEICDNVILGGNDEQIFQDCIKKIEIMDLKKREEELNMKLMLTDEETDIKIINEITEELMEIQKIVNRQEVS